MWRWVCAISFSKKLTKYSYYAYDIDTIEILKLKEKAKQEQLQNLHIYDSHTDFYDKLGSLNRIDVIIMEVIEHMSEEESKDFLIYILNVVIEKANIIIITTPNYDFNVNYCLDGKFRHSDHKWEMNRDQFKKFIETVTERCKINCSIEFFDIGDQVNEVSCSQGCIIRPICDCKMIEL